jgi:ATP diphosphatase
MADDTHQPNIGELLAIMARLRNLEGGCPWDLEQNFYTLVPCILEEAYEVVGAVERADSAALKEELGDLLFQIIFYAQIAWESGLFDFAAVVAGAAVKMTHRHPHVFEKTDITISSSKEQIKNWEACKVIERVSKGITNTLEGITTALPALTRALKLQKRAASAGFDWIHAERIFDKIEEEINELRQVITTGSTINADRAEDELGDIIFAIVNLGRYLGLDSEASLRRTNTKFERRFRKIEAWLSEQGRTLSDSNIADMEALWKRAKAEELIVSN